MELNTSYLGLQLANPLIAAASPLTMNLDSARRLEDAGAAAIVLRSLFFEEIVSDHPPGTGRQGEASVSAMPPASTLNYFPVNRQTDLDPDQYLNYIRLLKRSLSIPIIASLNGDTLGDWTRWASLVQEAQADGLELNLYHLATDPMVAPEDIEAQLLQVVKAVRASTRLPLAVKISPFFTSIPSICARLDDLGVSGIVLFNRFYQPDFDLEVLEEAPRIYLSNSSEVLLRIRWLAIVAPHLSCSLAATGGVHTADDVLKCIIAGALAVQLCSALLRHGPGAIEPILDSIRRWMDEHDVGSLERIRGSLSFNRCPDAATIERANYRRVLQNWSLPNSQSEQR